MKVLFLALLGVCALASVARADDWEDWIAAALLAQVISNGQQCAAWGTVCTANRPCCQYLGHGPMGCFNNQCLQAQCGYEGQECGAFIGECCWHLGLQCTGDFLGGRCVKNTLGK
ncbi:uncharacterized protein LOC106012377 [Aplysia californica]|uniref:Uncharacterized protein LOC106012377 n=1 Tax=Aplysia californica TaxID=6500 RepID=A0ABM1A4F7_APLCA|nr:uncharacterized protein LOC106012377 [Aplysia californica]XP_012940654.1 uncharacterized protein LOC106012377 [Aplysia californica]